MSTIVAQPTVANTLPPVQTAGLSDTARSYLRACVRNLRRAGTSAAHAAIYANDWADGYRAFAAGTHLSQLAGAAFDGWQYAHGEDAWWHCQIVDAAQDSADACNYGWR